jgi:hypothetical protein
MPPKITVGRHVTLEIRVEHEGRAVVARFAPGSHGFQSCSGDLVVPELLPAALAATWELAWTTATARKPRTDSAPRIAPPPRTPRGTSMTRPEVEHALGLRTGGMPLREVARTVGRPIGTLKRQFTAARKRLAHANGGGAP